MDKVKTSEEADAILDGYLIEKSHEILERFEVGFPIDRINEDEELELRTFIAAILGVEVKQITLSAMSSLPSEIVWENRNL